MRICLLVSVRSDFGLQRDLGPPPLATDEENRRCFFACTQDFPTPLSWEIAFVEGHRTLKFVASFGMNKMRPPHL